METDPGKLPPPPGLIASLMRGFDSVANHIQIILPPLLLDLFLWLGPHLHVNTFLQQFVDQLPTLSKAFPANFFNPAVAPPTWPVFVDQLNLFSILRTFPVGVTSLLSSSMPVLTPLGSPLAWEAGSLFGVVGWIFALTLLGWLAGALYYRWISVVVLDPQARSFGKPIFQTLLLSLIWVGALFILGLPVMLFLSIITYFSPFLGQIMLFIGAMMAAWLIMPVFFSVHGIFTLQLNAFRSIMGSLRMVRFTLPNTSLFLLAFVVINTGLNMLWSTPSENSWWMLVSIIGHAFVSTALLAASFIYYRDINAWLTVVFDLLQKQTSPVRLD